jgi:stearoyl-CoA desaturase (Delta-9 desaturase)
MLARIRRSHFDAMVAFGPLHAGCLLLFWIPFEWSYLLWLGVTYAVRMFGITAGFHRYFSHRSFRISRLTQFGLAFLAQTSAQKGVLWWAAHHRMHHRHSDTEDDIHSPLRRGFWSSHIGWLVSNDSAAYDRTIIQDFGKYPELALLNRYHRVPAVLFGCGVFLLGGYAAFIWGFVLSTVVLYHCTFSINSLAHLWGSRRYETRDGSRNNLLLAILTFGEGWHNNHHRFMYRARQGVRWWEIDITYYVLWMLSIFGIVRDLRQTSSGSRVAELVRER